MKVKRGQVGWGFWLQWVLASAVGWFVSFFFGWILSDIIGDFIGSGVLLGILAYSILGAVLGSGVSLMQSLVLGRRVSRAGWWVWASTVGFAVAGGGGYGAAVVAFDYSHVIGGLGSFTVVLRWIMVVALGGAMTGILQWLVLRGQVFRAGWWVLASTVGWGLSMAVVGAFLVVDVGFWSLFGLPVGGAVLGVVSGGALVWLLRQSVTKERGPRQRVNPGASP